MKTALGPWSWLTRVLLAVVLLASVGCVPGATWLPDSSGLVYTSRNGELRLFDVTTRKVQVLARTDTNTIWPAVSPDGQRFAVARVQKHDAGGVGFDAQYKTTLRVIVYDRQGQVQHQSPEMDWGHTRRANLYHDPREEVQLFWIRHPNALLLSGDDTFGVYQPKTKQLQRTPGSLLMVIGNSPVRPDGQGFLLLNMSGEKERGVQFLDWQGQGKQVGGALVALEPGEKKDEDLMVMLAVVPTCASRWEGKTAVIRWLDREVRIDTEKMTSTVDQVQPEKTAAGEVIAHHHAFPGTKVRLRVVQVQAQGKRKKIPDVESRYRVETLEAKGADPKVLVPEASLVRPFPSPDGKFLALRFFTQQKGNRSTDVEKILVVDHQGGEVATLEIDD